MNFSETLVSLASALLTTLTSSYLLRKLTGNALSWSNIGFLWLASSFFIIFVKPLIVPSLESQTVLIAEEKPSIEHEINFRDDQEAVTEIKTTIKTDFGCYTFSNHGATLLEADASHPSNKQNPFLKIIEPTAERHEQCFTVALKTHATPYYYTLLEHDTTDLADTLVYRASLSADEFIEKKFVIHHKEPYIDCAIRLSQAAGASDHIRILLSGPYIKELHLDNNCNTFFAGYGQRKIETISDIEVIAKKIVEKPELIGVENRYFANFLSQDKEHLVERAGFVIIDGARPFALIQSKTIEKPRIEWNLRFYWGPKSSALLRTADRRTESLLNFGWLGFISRPLSTIMISLLKFIFDYVGNFGIAIILLTILLKLLLLPISMQSTETIKKQKEFQKKMTYIKEKFKHDREAFGKAQTELLSNHGFPLMGFAGMFLQIPFIFALSWVLSHSVELYKAPFLWVPDLSSHDPYYILPLLVVGGMLTGAAFLKDNQQRIQLFIMTCIIAALSAQVPAGLALYFLASGAIGTIQTSFLQR